MDLLINERDPGPETARPNLIDGATASDYLSRIATAGPDERPQMESALRTYADAMRAEDRGNENEQLSKLFTDQEFFDQQSRRPAMKAASASSLEPDAVPMKIANQAYLEFATGRKSGELADGYESFRDAFGEKETGKPSITDQEMFSLVRDKYTGEKQRVLDRQLILGDVANGMFEEITSGVNQTASAYLQKYKTENPDFAKGLKPGEESQYLNGIIATRDDLRERFKKYAPTAKRLYDEVTRQTGQKDGPGAEDIALTLADMDKDDRDVLYSAVLMAAQRSGFDPKTILMQMRESLGRGTIGMAVQTARVMKGDVLRAKVRGYHEGMRLGTNDDNERALIAKDAEDQLKVIGVLREIANLSEKADPIEAVSKGWMGQLAEKSAYGVLGSFGIMATSMIPYVGPVLTFSAYRAQNYEQLMNEAPNLDPATASNYATMMAIPEALLDRLQVEILFPRAPVTKKLLQSMALSKKGAGGAAMNATKRVGVKTLFESGIELTQNAIPLVVDQIGMALEEDYPQHSFREDAAQWVDAVPETIGSMFIMSMLGGGFATISDIKNGRHLLEETRPMREAGISDEGAARVVAAPTEEEKLNILHEEYKKRTPESIVEGVAMGNERVAKQKAIAELPGQPTIELGAILGEPDADGNPARTWTLTGEDGKVLIETKSLEAAQQAMIEVKKAGWADTQSANSAMISHLLGSSEAEGRNVTFESNPLEDKRVADQMAKEPESIAQMQDRMKIEGMEGIDPTAVSILGETTVKKLADDSFQTQVKLLKGANPATVIEEYVEGRVRESLASGKVPIEFFRKEIAAYEAHSGETLMTGAYQSVIEAVSTLGVAYVGGKVKDKALPQGMVGFFRQMAIFFRNTFARALKLKKAIAEGAVSSDFASYLADSVGMSLDGKMDIARVQAQEKLLSNVKGKSESTQGEFTYSIASAEHIADIERRFEKLAKSPDKRLAMFEAAKRDLIELMNEHREDLSIISAKVIDPSAAIAQIENDRQATLADLDIEEKDAIAKSGAAITEQFGQRIEESKTKAKSAELTREANARAAERKKGIEKTFAEKRKTAAAKADAEIKRVKSVSETENVNAKQTAKSITAQEKLRQGIVELDALLSPFPAEIRGKVGGFATLSNIGTGEKALRDFLAKRIEMIDRELERVLKKEYLAGLRKLIKKLQPVKASGGAAKSPLGDTAQEIAIEAGKLSLLTNDQVAKEMLELDAAMNEGGADRNIYERWSMLNMFGDLKGRDAATLAVAFDWLKKVAQEGRDKTKMAREAHFASLKEISNAFLDDIGRFERSDRLRASHKKFFGRAGDWSGSVLRNHLSFEQFLSTLFQNSPEQVNYFFERMMKADNADRDMRIQFSLELLATIKAGANAAGKTAGKAAVDLKAPHENAVITLENIKTETAKLTVEQAEKMALGEIDSGKFTKEEIQDALDTQREELAGRDAKAAAEGRDNAPLAQRKFVEVSRRTGVEKGAPLSRDQAIQYLLTWNQRDGRKKMKLDGWKEDTGEQLQTFIEQDPVAVKVMEFLQKFYREGAARVNPVYVRIFGMNMPTGDNYAPASYDHQGNEVEIGPDGMATSGGSTPSFLKGRVSHSASVSTSGAVTIFQQHLAQQAHWVNFAELGRDFKHIFADADMKKSLRAKFGNYANEEVSKWTKLLETRGGDRSNSMAWMNGLLGTLIGGKAISSLGFNMRTLTLQTDAGMRFMFATEPGDVVRAFSDPAALVKSMPEIWFSAAIQRRIKGGMSPAMQFVFQQYSAKPGAMANFAYASMEPINKADAFFTTIGSAIVFRSAYTTAISEGMNETMAADHAMKEVDKAIYRFSQPIGVGQKSLVENSGNILVKSIMMFMSDMRFKTAMMIEAGFEIKKIAKDGKGNWRKPLKTIVTIEAMAFISHTMGNLYRTLLSDDDEEDIWTKNGYYNALALAPFAGLMFGGTIADVTFSKLFHERFFMPSRDPVVDTAMQGLRTLNNIDETLNVDDPEAMYRQWRNISKTMSVTPGLAAPAAALNLVSPAFGLAERLKENEK